MPFSFGGYMKFEFKKSLGQNFLKDDNVIDNIISSANIDKNTLVIEIGPGSGALSKKFVPICGQAILYEIDDRLEDVLTKELKLYNNYELIIGDFLLADVKKEIANLPYYITTPIIKKIIDDEIFADKMIIMIQKEVADRFSAKPKTSDYGAITVYLNCYYEIKKLFNVSKNCFIPQPKVDSSVIEMDLKDNFSTIKDRKKFNSLIKDSFQYKRKNLRNNLKDYDLLKIEKTLCKYNLNLNSRAEELPLEVFVDISNNL
jgi:16S rRNA (adenine1518-N6/adenine1519-N6)-dimethyltransferase